MVTRARALLLPMALLAACRSPAPPCLTADGSVETADAPTADSGPPAPDARPPDRAPEDTGPAPLDAFIAPNFAACTRPPCLNVRNNCPIPLWTHAVGTVPIDDGQVRRLDPGAQFQYAALPEFGGGRLYAYYKEPDSKQDRVRLVSDFNQFVEMSVDRDGPTGGFAQNYNVSYVDYLSLPVAMRATGATCAETRCAAPFERWTTRLGECPTELRNRYEQLATCIGSYNHCITPAGAATRDTTDPYCTKMRDAHGFAGSAIYGGYFPDHPATEVAFWDSVAAWNRGTVAGDADDDHYFKTEPYNHYARWIHEELGCRKVYAFSTDDHQDKAGFVRCVSPELNVVWCPDR
jgi:hypothetical protein